MTPYIREWKNFLKKEENKSDSTIANYLSTIEEYREFIRIPLKNATYDDFDTYIWRLKENGMKRLTINLKIGRVKNFYRWLKNKENVSMQIDKILDYDYFKFNNDKLLLTEFKVDEILSSSKFKIVDKVILLLLFTTCSRPQEVRILSKNCFIEKEKYTKVKIYNVGKEESRTGYIEKKYWKFIKDNYIDKIDTELLFPSSYNGGDKYFSKDLIHHKMEHIGQEIIGKKLTPTRIRKAGLNYLYRKGFDIFIIAEIADYTSLKNIYTQLELNDLEIEDRVKQHLKRNEKLFD